MFGLHAAGRGDGEERSPAVDEELMTDSAKAATVAADQNEESGPPGRLEGAGHGGQTEVGRTGRGKAKEKIFRCRAV